jgi:hypothetical protein
MVPGASKGDLLRLRVTKAMPAAIFSMTYCTGKQRLDEGLRTWFCGVAQMLPN